MEGAAGRVFHLSNPRASLLDKLVERMRLIGYPIETAPYPAWVQRIVDFGAKSPSSPIAPFLSLFVEKWSEAQISVMEMFCEGRFPSIDNSATQEALRGMGVDIPPVGEVLLGKYISYLLRTGFLPPPGGPVSRPVSMRPSRMPT
jgi:hypothetical protein